MKGELWWLFAIHQKSGSRQSSMEVKYRILRRSRSHACSSTIRNIRRNEPCTQHLLRRI